MGNGLLHALDADHIVAVSSVAVQGKASRGAILRTAFEWALGHGVSLLLICCVVLGFGLALPEQLSHLAELLVGAILLAVGSSLLWALARGEVTLSRHEHPQLPPHLHLHKHSHSRLGHHKSVFIGFIHGTAGSAPLLAVLPLVIRNEFLFAGLYILVFTLFVAIMMCCFGGLLGAFIQRLQQRYRHGLAVFQLVMGLQSLGFGGFWILKAF
jgi:hypothetical protein